MLIRSLPLACGISAICWGRPVRPRNDEHGHSGAIIAPAGAATRMEASMKLQAPATLIVSALLAAVPLSSPPLAQTTDTKASPPQNATANTTRATPKHRYWRFRGGKHPHYGSRRLGT